MDGKRGRGPRLGGPPRRGPPERSHALLEKGHLPRLIKPSRLASNDPHRRVKPPDLARPVINPSLKQVTICLLRLCQIDSRSESFVFKNVIPRENRSGFASQRILSPVFRLGLNSSLRKESGNKHSRKEPADQKIHQADHGIA